MRGPRGHSNIAIDTHARGPTIGPWADGPVGVARIRITGGASPATTRELPSLSLRREEWVEIGRRMGWEPTDGAEAARVLDMEEFFPIAEDRVRTIAARVGDEGEEDRKYWDGPGDPQKVGLAVRLHAAADALGHLNEICDWQPRKGGPV